MYTKESKYRITDPSLSAEGMELVIKEEGSDIKIIFETDDMKPDRFFDLPKSVLNDIVSVLNKFT